MKVKLYTVVGIHPDNIDRAAEDATYVEWVVATTSQEAADHAKAMYDDREDSFVVAVFEGHRVDVYRDMGLASGPRGLAWAKQSGKVS